jgi:hypothetical protein
MKSNVQGIDHRRSSRRRAFMRAIIYYPGQTEHAGCMVRDLSQDGALLELPLARELPLVFWLRLEGESKLRFCNVAWHSENHLGVEFSEQIVDRRRVERWGEPFSVCVKPHLPAE